METVAWQVGQLNFVPPSRRSTPTGISPPQGHGIDTERIRDNRDIESLAQRWFSSPEVEELKSLPAEQRAHAFFLGWTRKEAFVKAVGDGITYGLDQFDVSLSPHVPPQLKRVREDESPERQWTLLDLKPSRDHAAALVVECPGAKVRTWDVDEGLIR